MISKKNVNLSLPIVEVGLQPPSHPFSKGSIYVKVPQITLFVPPQGIEPRCYSTTPNVLPLDERGMDEK